jgi:pimeloyl-ACP methyl ester carboxylesterase
MPRALVQPGIELEYDTFGSPDDPALLLIMGFSAQMTAWDDKFCQLFADSGLFVVRFDNRDCGLSTKLDGQTVDLGAVILAALSDQPVPPVPYTLSDMAADAVGLLDQLGIERAHVMGASMGGMIAQHVAIEHPHRVRSLVSVMSMPGEPDVGQPTAEAAAALLDPPATSREDYIASAPKWMIWQSKKYADIDQVKADAASDYDRSFYPEGSPRQLAALYASGRRTEGLQALDIPTLVIHGRDDTLIAPSGGFRTAELVPGAHLLYVADMGHDFPEPLWPLFVDAVVSHVRRAG